MQRLTKLGNPLPRSFPDNGILTVCTHKLICFSACEKEISLAQVAC